MGIPPELKYENEGGPSLAQLFTTLAHGSQSPLPDKRDLLHWVLFNFIIGNADAHAKNISFLFGKSGNERGPHLAPFYDLVCTEIYEELSKKHAQKIGGEYRPKYITSRHWARFATSIDINPNYLRKVGHQLCSKIENAAIPLADEISQAHSGYKTLTQVLQVLEKRIRVLETGLQF
jgi:serine/threonine-protein kinase HipA